MESLVNVITSPRKKLQLDPLDLLLHAEMGDGREMLNEQLQSPSARSGLRHLYFHKADKNGEFILSRDPEATEFVMMARIDESKQRFDIYRRKPTEIQFVEGVPDARLTWNVAADKWVASVSIDSLVCDECAFRRVDPEAAPNSKSHTILNISQGMEKIHSHQHWFWVDVTGQATECGDRRIFECKHCDNENRFNSANSSLILSPPGSPRAKKDLAVRSTAPTVSPDGNLSIKFISMDRTILPSSRNLQCHSENQCCFQLLKIGGSRFAIDYRAPFSPLQSFCLALSTHFWT